MGALYQLMIAVPYHYVTHSTTKPYFLLPKLSSNNIDVFYVPQHRPNNVKLFIYIFLGVKDWMNSPLTFSCFQFSTPLCYVVTILVPYFSFIFCLHPLSFHFSTGGECLHLFSSVSAHLSGTKTGLPETDSWRRRRG